MPSRSHGKRHYETHLETYHMKTNAYRHTVRVFKIDATIRNTFPKCICGVTPLQTGRLLLRIGKFFSEESEGFFQRVLGSYTHKFPKRSAASLTYLPRSRLDLPHLRLGLPHLRLSRNSGPATEGFSNHGINFKDAYRTYYERHENLQKTYRRTGRHTIQKTEIRNMGPR